MGMIKLQPALRKECLQGVNTGVDIEEISRFISRDYLHFKRLYERLFTPKEIEYCLSFKSPACHFAANFAGKEAIYKAIHRYFDVKLSDIEILRRNDGEPFVNLNSKLPGPIGASLSASNLQIKLSLSHSNLYAIAFAIVYLEEKKQRVLMDLA